MMKSIHVWWFLASTCEWRVSETRQQHSQVVLAYATVELHKADIYLDRGKLTPEEHDLMVSFAVTIQGWSTQRTSMIHLKESEMCRFDQYFSGTFSFARCRSGSACLRWFQRCAAGKSSEWIKSSPSILEVLQCFTPFSRAICWISHCSRHEVPAVGQYASAKVWMDTQRTLFSIGNARELLLRCWM